jgi:hypothetical protein
MHPVGAENVVQARGPRFLWRDNVAEDRAWRSRSSALSSFGSFSCSGSHAVGKKTVGYGYPCQVGDLTDGDLGTAGSGDCKGHPAPRRQLRRRSEDASSDSRKSRELGDRTPLVSQLGS